MARPAGGVEHLDEARELLERAKTADELRTAQAVLLPLVLGLSMEQTALAIGRSTSAACAMRMRFCRIAEGSAEPPRGKHELRNRAHATLDQERRMIATVCGRAQHAGSTLVPRLKEAMQAQCGKAVALSSVYRLLQRHGWRRVAPEATQAGLPAGAKERRSRPRPRWEKG
jgi:Winged helix-turn helix